MALEAEFRRFFRNNPVVTKLNFRLPGQREISPHGFRLLADCIVANDEPDAPARLRHSMRIRTRPQYVERGAVAMYRPWRGRNSGGFMVHADTLFFRSNDIFTTVMGRAIAYHESIHTLVDAYGVNARWDDSEGGAFLGAALFLLECGFDYQRRPPMGNYSPAVYAPLEHVFPIALAVKARSNNYTQTVPITAAEHRELRTAMLGLGFGSNLLQSDGIRGRRIVNGAWI